MNRMGFEMSGRTPVPTWPPSYTPPPRRGLLIELKSKKFSQKLMIRQELFWLENLVREKVLDPGQSVWEVWGPSTGATYSLDSLFP